MAWLVEIMSNRIFMVSTVDVVEMALESVHKSTFCLSNILDFANFASDHVVYQIAAFTIYSYFG